MDPVTNFKSDGIDLGAGREPQLIVSRDQGAELSITVPGVANGLYVLMWGGGGGGGGGGSEPGPGYQGNGGGGGGSAQWLDFLLEMMTQL